MILLIRSHKITLNRELGVKVPFEAIEKWFEFEQEMSLQIPLKF